VGHEKAGPEKTFPKDFLVEKYRCQKTQNHGESQREERVDAGIAQGNEKEAVGEKIDVVSDPDEGYGTQVETREAQEQVDYDRDENENQKKKIERRYEEIAHWVVVDAFSPSRSEHTGA
jgi:hypothetical protein